MLANPIRPNFTANANQYECFSLEFTAFEYDKAPTGGWGLHLVIEDPEEGLAIALRATDVE
jgi:hypothetical protein